MAKNFLKLIMCLVLISVTGTFSQGATIGYWQFNENAPGLQAAGTVGEIIDSSGNGHHGTAVGTTLPSYVAGVNDPTSASQLDISDDRVDVPHSTDFDLMLADSQDYTIEAIVKMSPGTVNDAPAFITKRDTIGMGWSFRTLKTGELALYLEGTENNFLHPGVSGNTNVRDDLWHHVAVVIDANADPALASATFYLDHVADGTTLLTDGVYNDGDWINENIVNTHGVWIGDFIGRSMDQMVGDIDAVRFSTGKLDPSEFLPFAAQTIETIEHVGVTDPTQEGFTLNDTNASSTWTDALSTPAAGRLQEVSESIAHYTADVNATQLAHESGWTATAVMQLNENPTEEIRFNTMLAVDDGSDTWALHFVGGSGVTETGVFASGQYLGNRIFEQIDLDSSVDPTDGFHTYQIVYDPAGDGGNGSVTFYVDGLEAGTQTRDQVVDASLSQLVFGDNCSGDGAASDSLWSLVRLEAGQHPMISDSLPGDANNDGIVNDADAAILAANWQGSGGWGQGDFNGDGIVNDMDATILATNWQTVGAGASVPEPGLAALLLSGLVGLLIVCYKRHA